MNLSFDIHGHLRPYKRIKVSSKEFKTQFVDPFNKSSNRHELFQQYEHYTLDFQEQITNEFVHYINGSFVTKKYNPKDIDFVNLLDFIHNNIFKK
ncbi:MAG: hypothetical protein AAF849_07235 [Bacteroidota bacterium]